MIYGLLTIPVLPRLKVSSHIVNEFDLTPAINGLDWIGLGP